MNYQAGHIKRRRRTKAQTEQLDRQIIAVLNDDHPQSVRHVFYRMTDTRLAQSVEKSDRGYNQIQNRVKRLRRSGRVPYDWIADSTRMGWFTNTYASPSEFIRAHADAYRADLWQDSDFHVEVWAESRSIAGVIRGVCSELAVSLYPCGGFASITLAYEAAKEMVWVHRNTGREPLILYVGDYDPAGVLIDISLHKELRKHLDDIPLHFRRLAVTEEQIQRWELPSRPRKKGDKRAMHITETVEAEAIPAHLLRALIRDEVESVLPNHAMEISRIAEESERQHLFRMADLMEANP